MVNFADSDEQQTACSQSLKGIVMCRVLVPTDFSEASLLVTKEALSWVDAIDGELLLLHVVPDVCLRWLDHLSLTLIDQSTLESGYNDLRAEGHRKFSAWLPQQPHARYRMHVVVGDTAEAILEVAQVEAADLIIMREATRRWWRPVLTGSVTNTVRRRAHIPVVVWSGIEQMSRRTGETGAWHLREAEPLRESNQSIIEWSNL
jgi:nucleotide-binding universal stress UspA family protein